MRKLVIEKSAVKNNLAVIKERAAGAVIYGVLSGDGGGAGIAALASFSGTRVSATLRCLKCPRPRRCARPALWTRKS